MYAQRTLFHAASSCIHPISADFRSVRSPSGSNEVSEKWDVRWLFVKRLRSFVLLAGAASFVLNAALLMPAIDLQSVQRREELGVRLADHGALNSDLALRREQGNDA